MVKKLFLFMMLATASLGLNAQEKQNLTLEQIVKDFPADILNPRETIVGWYDAKTLILGLEDGTYCLHDIKNGTRTAYEMPKPKAEPAILEELRKTVDNPTFSPDQTKIAYTLNNNLYVMDVATNERTAITTDGSDLILNGWSSWVYYEEILGRPTKYKAFWWSPDSKKIAYYKFDDTNVPMFPIFNSEGKHGSLKETRYPKAGDENPKVEIAMVDLETGKTVWADFNRDDDQYFGIPFWSAESDKFMVPWMPRDQNHLILYEVSPVDGSKTHLYEERQDTWIDWINDMQFVEDGFFMTRDFDGWAQIYYQSFDGKTFEKLTFGNNWRTRILSIDMKKQVLYYTSRCEASTRFDVYKLNLKTKKSERISFGEFNFMNVQMSPDNKYFAASISNVATPERNVIVKVGRPEIQSVVSDRKGAGYDNYKIAESQMVYIDVDGYRFPGSIILPVDMDSTKQHPVIISMYGGPDAGTVMDVWKAPSVRNQLWANQGVIQINIDHRASGHFGKKGVNEIFRNLGKVEIADYIEWVKYLRTLPYVNPEKIGIHGFSFGGTMTVLALTDGADYFQYGIAGGGVYDWQLYDTHYTERYMDTPQDNPEGYEFTRVWNRVEKYKGGDGNNGMLRLTHGTSDDNVHMQSSMQLIDALQKANKEFELMLYPGGFHGYRGLQGRHSEKMDNIFWYKYLLGQELPDVLK